MVQVTVTTSKVTVVLGSVKYVDQIPCQTSFDKNNKISVIKTKIIVSAAYIIPHICHTSSLRGQVESARLSKYLMK